MKKLKEFDKYMDGYEAGEKAYNISKNPENPYPKNTLEWEGWEDAINDKRKSKG